MPIDQTIFRPPLPHAFQRPAHCKRLADALSAASASRAEIAAERTRVDGLAAWRAHAEQRLDELAQAPQAIRDLQRQVGSADAQALGARLGAAERDLDQIRPVPVQLAPLVVLPQQLRELDTKTASRIDRAFEHLERLKQELDRMEGVARELHAKLERLEARVDACCGPQGGGAGSAKGPTAPAKGGPRTSA